MRRRFWTLLAALPLGACCCPCAMPVPNAPATGARSSASGAPEPARPTRGSPTAGSASGRGVRIQPSATGAVAPPGPALLRLQPRVAVSSIARAGRLRPAPRAVAMGGAAPAATPEAAAAGHFEVLHVEFRDQASREHGLPAAFPPFAAVGPFASVFVPTSDVERFVQEASAAPGFLWIDADEPCRLQLPGALTLSGDMPRGGESELVVQGGRAGRRGAGVLLAVLSTGLDARHPDFVEVVDGKPRSRLAWYWDTLRDPRAWPGARAAPLAYPDGTSVGALLDNAALTALLAGSEPALDPRGDGTALAGIAAGNGRASEGAQAGVAPEATLIAVRMGSGEDGRIENAALTAAVCRWLVEVAAGRPLVVVVGFGGTGGGRDGRLISERMLDQWFPPEAAGRALVVAAGDGAGAGTHATLALGGGRSDTRLHVRSRPGSSHVKSLTVWIAGTDAEEVWAVGTSDTLRILDQDMYFDPRSAQTVFRLTTDGREGFVTLRPESGRAYRGDAWIQTGRFDGEAVSEAALIETPATAGTALAVGSSDWNDVVPAKNGYARLSEGEAPMVHGALSPFSAPGMRRLDGLVKPDLIAPGRWFLAPRADPRAASGDGTQVLSADGLYVAVGGTAAAAAYAAGVLALLLERQPSDTWGRIRARVEAALSRDQFTGPVPSAQWGHGRLDRAAVDRLLGTPP